MKHLQAVKRAPRYLKGIYGKGLILRPGKNRQLSAFVDANLGFHTECKLESITRHIILYNKAVIYASSTLQRPVALSLSEAAFVALSEACKVVITPRNILEESVF